MTGPSSDAPVCNMIGITTETQWPPKPVTGGSPGGSSKLHLLGSSTRYIYFGHPKEGSNKLLSTP